MDNSGPLERQFTKLDAATQAKLRSTQILTTLPQIVSELMQNSLDAKASHIDMGINFEDWMCWVRDDGSGIRKQDLEAFCAEDTSMRYHTSKEYAPGSINSTSTYGFRGEALASAAQVSCLEIASRSIKSRTTWSVIKKADQLLYNGEAIRWRRESPGTTVCVRDAFFNLPVRRLSHPSSTKTWDLVRQEIEIYAIISPSVSFTLEDLHKSRENGASSRILRIPKTLSTLTAFRHLYGRALAEKVETINLADGNLKVEGFISLHGASSRIYQFLYINSHPITLCDFHRLVDVEFSSSTYGKNCLNDRNESSGASADSRPSPRKSEKKPVYVLNIIIPPAEVDNSFEPRKSVVGLQYKTSVISLLTRLIRGFLTKYGFSHKSSKLERESSATQIFEMPLKRRRMIMDEGHDIAGRSLMTHTPGVQPSSSQTFAVPDDMDLTAVLGGCARAKDSLDTVSLAALRSSTTTRETLAFENNFVQRRTITSLPFESRSQTAIPTWLLNALETNDSYAHPEPTIPIVNSSQSYGPPTAEFNAGHSVQQHSCQSANIPLLSANLNSISTFFSKEDLSLAVIIGQVDKKFIACSITSPNPLDNVPHTQEATGSTFASSDTSTLVLIDQHAADERVRVEGFLKELCFGFLYNCNKFAETPRGIRLQTLNPPKPVLVTRHELRTLEGSREVQEAFRNWGFCFTGYPLPDSTTDSPENDTNDDDNHGLGQILVQTVPDIVSDKLLQEGELQDLVKGFLAQFQADLPSLSSLPGTCSSQEADQEFLWLKALRYCPRPLLDLVNLKACRGAIMFNDTLDATQCESLVRQLASTAYPFQCAHGRPSLVPLVELNPQTGSLGPRRAPPCDWSKLRD